jgi:nucleotide-binding universal stress UspA family protein
MKPSSVVVPLDGSMTAERALTIARPLARDLGAELVVMTRSPAYDGADAVAYLEGAVRWHASEAPLERTALVEGLEPADAIRKVAEEHEPAIVCMTTHGRGRLRWATVGSVAEGVIRSATEPILLVGPRVRDHWLQRPGRIVVCVDGAATDRRSVEHACDWAEALDLELQLVHVFHPLDIEVANSERLFGPLAAIAQARNLKVGTAEVLRSSFVPGAIVDWAEDVDATLLVMAAHHHSSLARFVLGSTTMAIVHLAPCPVLVVPPVEA